MISTPNAPEVTTIRGPSYQDITKEHLYGANVRVESLSVTSIGVVVTLREPSDRIYGNGRSVPDKVWKEVYELQVRPVNGSGGCVGELVLTKVIEGTHTPAHPAEEKVEFPGGGAS